MSMKKNSSKGNVKNKKGRLSEKSTSFHGRVSEDMVGKLIRPRTVPDLISGRSTFPTETVTISRPKLTKLLLNVTVQRSLGVVHVLISPELTVGDLIAAVLRQYVKEGRRPVFPSLDASGFHLHYSQFSLESKLSSLSIHALKMNKMLIVACTPVEFVMNSVKIARY